jgi:hypothetical protein
MHPFSMSQEHAGYQSPDNSLTGSDPGMGLPTGMVLRRSEHQQLYMQFQSRYPMGALVSELLQIQDGKFVVRASVQVGGVTLATGLAAAYSPEMSEDQARLRALEVVGVFPTVAVTTQEVKAELISPPRMFATAPQTQLGASPSPYPTVAPSHFAPEMAIETPYQRTEQPSLDLSEQAVPPTPSHPRSQPPTSKRTPSAERGGTKATKASAPAPLIDLADVIAQTSVELKRLGWTEAQGRQHLQKHYNGKRSRQQLQDDELLDFLHFLERQPNPSETLF